MPLRRSPPGPEPEKLFIFEKQTASQIWETYYKDIPLEVFRRLVSYDPTSPDPKKDLTGAYSKYLFDLWKKDPSADHPETKTILRRYDFLRTNNMVPQEEALFSARSVDALRQMVNRIEGAHFEIIGMSEGRLLVRTTSKKANKLFGMKSKWCTTWDNDSHWNQYSVKGPIIILIHGDFSGGLTYESIAGLDEEWQAVFPSTGYGLEIRNQSNDNMQPSLKEFKHLCGKILGDLEDYLAGLGTPLDEFKDEDEEPFLAWELLVRPNVDSWGHERPWYVSFRFKSTDENGGTVDRHSFEGRIFTAHGGGKAASIAKPIVKSLGLDISKAYVHIGSDLNTLLDFLSEFLYDEETLGTMVDNSTLTSVSSFEEGLGGVKFGGVLFDSSSDLAGLLPLLFEAMGWPVSSISSAGGITLVGDGKGPGKDHWASVLSPEDLAYAKAEYPSLFSGKED